MIWRAPPATRILRSVYRLIVKPLGRSDVLRKNHRGRPSRFIPGVPMKLEKYALLAEILASVAVVVTLVVLLIEVRGNTAAIRAATLLEVNKIARDHLVLMWSDANASRIDQIGSQDLSQLTADERQRYYWNVRSFWLGMQTVYRQYDLGILPEEEWQVYHDVICLNISWPGTRELWTGTDLIPAFVSVVEACPEF